MYIRQSLQQSKQFNRIIKLKAKIGGYDINTDECLLISFDVLKDRRNIIVLRPRSFHVHTARGKRLIRIQELDPTLPVNDGEYCFINVLSFLSSTFQYKVLYDRNIFFIDNKCIIFFNFYEKSTSLKKHIKKFTLAQIWG